MASVIKPKRSAVANTPPTTANIQQYEIAINTADKKIYTRDGTDNILVIGAGNVSGLADVALSSLADTQILSYNASTSKWINIDNYATQVKEVVKNSTGATLTKGTVVYVSGASGSNILVAKAQANAEITSSRTFGILEADIANGASGYCVRSGKLAGLDTSAYAEGDPIYLSPTTAGGFVVGFANKPSAPNHLVYLGVVTRSQVNNGEIQVSISNGWELDEIHDVQIGTKANGNTLIYDATSSTWKNASLTAGTDTSVTNGAGSITIGNTSTLASVTGRGATTSSAISITNSTASSNTSTGALTITGGLGVGGNINAGGNVTASTNLVSTYSAGDEGGEIQLAKPQTNSTLAGTVSIDIYQNKLRIFENGGTARGVYIDLTTAAAGVATNLMSGGGTVTSVSGTGTVAGLSLSGTVTTSGNLTLSGALSTPVSTINDSTTVGQNLVKLTNPSAITFLRVNADNTVSTLDAATFRTAIGAQASGSYLTANQTVTLSGDVTGSGSTAITATLANSGVTAGSYTLASITVDAKGRITAASSGTAGASLTGLTQDSGSFITSLGAGAGQSGSGGAVTIGYQAGQSNSYGGGGVHIGYQAGKASIGGNITIGNSAGVALGYGPYCTIIGTNAATSITSASYNTIIGAEAAKQAGNIDHLTAVGNMSGFYASGTASTLLGSNAGYYSGGIERVALGAYSMRGSPSWNSTGAYSVGVGAYTLFNYTSGEKNVAVGHSALYSATTSKWNVAIGHNAGYGLTTGSDNNVIIGYLAGYTGTNNLTSSATNNILIGASAQASSSSATNEITLGNSSITRLRIPGLGIDWTSATVPTGGGGGGGTSITNTVVTTTTQTATKDNRYILTNASATTVTLPATPTLGDTVYIIVANGLTTNVIARNGSPIMGLAEDLTVDGSTASFGLFYVNSTLGWRII